MKFICTVLSYVLLLETIVATPYVFASNNGNAQAAAAAATGAATQAQAQAGAQGSGGQSGRRFGDSTTADQMTKESKTIKGMGQEGGDNPGEYKEKYKVNGATNDGKYDKESAQEIIDARLSELDAFHGGQSDGENDDDGTHFKFKDKVYSEFKTCDLQVYNDEWRSMNYQEKSNEVVMMALEAILSGEGVEDFHGADRDSLGRAKPGSSIRSMIKAVSDDYKKYRESKKEMAGMHQEKLFCKCVLIQDPRSEKFAGAKLDAFNEKCPDERAIHEELVAASASPDGAAIRKKEILVEYLTEQSEYNQEKAIMADNMQARVSALKAYLEGYNWQSLLDGKEDTTEEMNWPRSISLKTWNTFSKSKKSDVKDECRQLERKTPGDVGTDDDLLNCDTKGSPHVKSYKGYRAFEAWDYHVSNTGGWATDIGKGIASVGIMAYAVGEVVERSMKSLVTWSNQWDTIWNFTRMWNALWRKTEGRKGDFIYKYKRTGSGAAWVKNSRFKRVLLTPFTYACGDMTSHKRKSLKGLAKIKNGGRHWWTSVAKGKVTAAKKVNYVMRHAPPGLPGDIGNCIKTLYNIGEKDENGESHAILDPFMAGGKTKVNPDGRYWKKIQDSFAYLLNLERIIDTRINLVKDVGTSEYRKNDEGKALGASQRQKTKNLGNMMMNADDFLFSGFGTITDFDDLEKPFPDKFTLKKVQDYGAKNLFNDIPVLKEDIVQSVKEEVKRYALEQEFFNDEEDLNKFAEYTYRFHFEFPKKTAKGLNRYPTPGLTTFVAFIEFTIGAIKESSMRQKESYGSLASQYAADLNTTKGYYEGGPAAHKSGDGSRNVNLGPLELRELNLLSLNSDQMSGFAGAQSGEIKTEKFENAKLGAYNAGKAALADTKSERAKRYSHYKNSVGNTKRGKRMLKKAKEFQKKFTDPMGTAKAMMSGSDPLSSTAMASMKSPVKRTAPTASIRKKSASKSNFSSSPRRSSNYGSSSSSSGYSNQSSSGMSGTDMDHMINSAKRDNDLDSDEADTIFTKISKTYFRNLDRIFSKKSGDEAKDAQDEAAAKKPNTKDESEINDILDM